jgi:hypothetical protein
MSPQAGELLLNEVAPRIRSSMPSLMPIGSEDPEELAQDTLAIAAGLLESTERRGKQVTPGNIAYFAIRLSRQGRRSTRYKKNDVMHPATQLCGRSRVQSLDDPIASESDSEEGLCLHDTLAARNEDPAQAATRRLDWTRLVACLDATARAILCCMLEGEDLISLVPKLKRSHTALRNDKRRLAMLVLEHLGEDILRQVQELPAWMDNLVANRETFACRVERQAA